MNNDLMNGDSKTQEAMADLLVFKDFRPSPSMVGAIVPQMILRKLIDSLPKTNLYNIKSDLHQSIRNCDHGMEGLMKVLKEFIAFQDTIALLQEDDEAPNCFITDTDIPQDEADLDSPLEK